jgi:hypothetical protein
VNIFEDCWVADTHTALWHLFDDKRLSAAAEAFICEAATARHKIREVRPVDVAEGRCSFSSIKLNE